MKPGAPWSIKGIEPEARETAKNRAREAGMTLGQWINQAIANAGEPARQQPVPTAEPAGSALDTARIMRAIAEIARRVDNVAAGAAGRDQGVEARLAEISARVEEIGKTTPPDAPVFDQSRIERGLVAIARRVEQVEKAAASGAAIEALRDEINSRPDQQMTSDALSAVSAEVGSSISSLSERLDRMEAAITERAAPDVVGPSFDQNPAVERIGEDVRKLMNGMVNLGGKIDAIDEQVREQQSGLSALQQLVDGQASGDRAVLRDELRELVQHTDNKEIDSTVIQVAIASAIAPLSASIAQLQEKLEQQPQTTPDTSDAGDEPSSADETEALEPALEDPTITDEDAGAATKPAAEHSSMSDAPVVDPQPVDDITGFASLHDLTTADDIQVRPLDEDDGFFREIEGTPDNRSDAPQSETQNPPRISEEVIKGTAAEQSAPMPEEPLDHVPDDANPPDRPRRLVPVESLLGGAPPEGSRPRESGPAGFVPVSESNDAPPLRAERREPDAGTARKPFRLDEPLDLSRQTPAAAPAGYPGRRRWLGYLLVAVFFLIIFVGGYMFFATQQGKQLADDLGLLKQQVVLFFDSLADSDVLESDKADAPSTSSEQQGSGTVSGPAPASSASSANEEVIPAATGARVAALAPAPAASAPPASTDEERASTTSDAAPTPAPAPSPAPALAPEPEAAPPAAPAAEKSAFDLVRDKATAGDADAQYDLGVRYRDGIGIEANYSAAADWFDLAAQQGHVPAQLGLGIMYKQGLGRPRDLDLAKLWLHAAARAGDPDAQKLLGEVYVDNEAGVPDYFQAARWFKAAAEQGMVDAQYNMGHLYEGGLGVPQDMNQAYYWFSLAAKAGDREAPLDAERISLLLTPEEKAVIDEQVLGFSTGASNEGSPVAGPAAGTAGADSEILRRRDEIRTLQQLLIARGYDPGTPDGIPGSKTRDAVRNWQQDHGMAGDGRISRAVLESLKSGG